jgi:hypothetical protein
MKTPGRELQFVRLARLALAASRSFETWKLASKVLQFCKMPSSAY